MIYHWGVSQTSRKRLWGQIGTIIALEVSTYAGIPFIRPDANSSFGLMAVRFRQRILKILFWKQNFCLIPGIPPHKKPHMLIIALSCPHNHFPDAIYYVFKTNHGFPAGYGLRIRSVKRYDCRLYNATYEEQLQEVGDRACAAWRKSYSESLRNLRGGIGGVPVEILLSRQNFQGNSVWARRTSSPDGELSPTGTQVIPAR